MTKSAFGVAKIGKHREGKGGKSCAISAYAKCLNISSGFKKYSPVRPLCKPKKGTDGG